MGFKAAVSWSLRFKLIKLIKRSNYELFGALTLNSSQFIIKYASSLGKI